MKHAKAKLKFECPRCGFALEAEASLKGKAVQCPECSIYVVAPPAPLKEGVSLNGFKAERKLAEGANCEIWLASQESLARKVALKVLAPTSRDPEFVSRFIQEAKTLGRLKHPNIIEAYYAGFDKGVYFLAEDLLEGSDLGQRLAASGKLPESEALAIARKIADALRYAWAKFGVLHRDIKPANIMMGSDGEPRLMDLGISSCMSEPGGLGLPEGVVGTPAYMSPEQAKSPNGIDCRSDIYSLGATLFHLTTGTQPFDSPLAATLLFKQISAPLPSPRERNPALSRQCSALIKAMMSKNPDERQPGWDEVIRDIDLALAKRFPAGATPLSNWGSLRKIAPSALALKSGASTPGGLLRSSGHLIAAGMAAALLLVPSAWAFLEFKGKGEALPGPKPELAENAQELKETPLAIPAVLLRDNAPDIAKIVKGKTLSFDSRTLEIELEYDFSDVSQLKDWTPCGASASAANGALALEAECRADCELKIVFDELRASSTASFLRNGLGAGLRAKDGSGAMFVCSSFQSEADGYILTDASGRRLPAKLASSRAKPGQRLSLELSWSSGKSSFSAGGRRWPSLAFEPKDGAKLVLNSAWAKCEYAKIRISGRLNRDWYEAQAFEAPTQALLASGR